MMFPIEFAYLLIYFGIAGFYVIIFSDNLPEGLMDEPHSHLFWFQFAILITLDFFFWPLSILIRVLDKLELPFLYLLIWFLSFLLREKPSEYTEHGET